MKFEVTQNHCFGFDIAPFNQQGHLVSPHPRIATIRTSSSVQIKTASVDIFYVKNQWLRMVEDDAKISALVNHS